MAHSLRDLYMDELRDLYSAEEQILVALPKMVSAASSPDLRHAFERHLEQTRVQRERLDLIFKQLNERGSGHHCEGMAGLIREGEERLQDDSPPDVKDAALIAAAQRVEHYEIAGYGTARTYARMLGDWESERLLQQTLDEEGETDHLLTGLALSGINEAAEDGTRSLAAERWSRLRFLDVDDLDRDVVDYGDVQVRNRAGDDLGSLDGFIVETRSGRPFYFVVDSGGWFMGRRYLVPIGKGEFDVVSKLLRLDLDKDTIKRYPEFSTTGFMAMTDDEVRRYERRLLESFSPEAARTPAYWESYDRLPEYRQPEWVRSDAWASTRGTGRAVGDTASRRTSWTGETDRGIGRSPAASPDARTEEIVVAQQDEYARDPRDNTRTDAVRGVEDDRGRSRRNRDDDLIR